MSPLIWILFLGVTIALCVPLAWSSDSAAHQTCAAAAAQLDEYGGGRIVDITHAYRPDLPAPGRDSLGPVTQLAESMANGSISNVSELRMLVHSGTHVDAPGHMVQEHFEAGLGVDKLDLDVLNGKLATHGLKVLAVKSTKIWWQFYTHQNRRRTNQINFVRSRRTSNVQEFACKDQLDLIWLMISVFDPSSQVQRYLSMFQETQI